MMVNLTDGSSETPQNAQNFVQSNGYTFPLYHDADLDAAKTYEIYSIPTTLFINADGSLAFDVVGAMHENTLYTRIEAIIK